MSLSSLIRGNAFADIPPATLATVATHASKPNNGADSVRAEVSQSACDSLRHLPNCRKVSQRTCDSKNEESDPETQQRRGGVPTVATVATVARGTPENQKTASPLTSDWWRLRFQDRPLLVVFSPDATAAEMAAIYPGAVSGKPFAPVVSAPRSPMTPDEEKTIRAWLASIGEQDPETIALTLAACQQDGATRAETLREATKAAK